MLEDTQQSIAKSKARITFLEKRVSELELEVATTPTVGYQRRKFREAKKALVHVKEALDAEREQLESLVGMAEADAELEDMMSPEQLVSWREFEAQQAAESKARVKSEQEAEKRRDAFRVIEGGKD